MFLVPLMAAIVFSSKLFIEKDIIVNARYPIEMAFVSIVATFVWVLIFGTVSILFEIYGNKNKRERQHTSMRDIGWMLLNGLVASGFFTYLLYTGLQSASTAFTAMSQGVDLLATALIALLFYHARFRRRFWVLAVLLSIGTYFVAVGSFKFAVPQQGDLYIIASAIALASTNNLIESLTRRNGILRIVFYNYLGGAIFLGLYLLSQQTPILFYDIPWVAMGIIGLANILILLLLAKSFNLINASNTLAIFMLAPVINALTGVLLGVTNLNLIQWISMFMVVLAGVWMAKDMRSRYSHKR